ncbi:NAD(P)/FAD-dependent oxidoreductase [Cyanobium sp. HWJ4-Hawea]|uniref:NAD(P)/FAD-dependent oxidoreductase n=1 Tax=Cyanobium sp. HWJ4-Hawea TaxID=2823713 RepID=UPI0020CF1633|nr:NAD(P)/FAD-dependent oxidoreductase [Cyanobium sp. HWJ4-Hawea]
MLDRRCDVLVVGAGPAGAELARSLAQAGVDVVLIDRLADLSQAAFSSAAMPLASLDRFGLPAEIIATRWNGWQLFGPQQARRQWLAEQPLGAVLDFAKLRLWLVQQVDAWGGRILLGWQALGCQQQADHVLTQLRGPSGQIATVTSRWVVDATGERRALLGEPAQASTRGRDGLVSGLGVEWLLETSAEQAEAWSSRLSFFIGSTWVEQGYGWIFPMANHQLKLGVCRLVDPRRRQLPLQRELAHLIEFTGLGKATVLDRHGGRIRSTVRRQEAHQRGRLLGLGDAVSTANLLGGEGIRHALTSARVLAPLLLETLADPTNADRLLAAYPQQLRQALGRRWSLSGRLARRTWLGLTDQVADRRLDRLLTGLQAKRAEDLSALFFDYRFERYGLKALAYGLGWR